MVKVLKRRPGMPSNFPRSSSAIFARVERSTSSVRRKVTSTPIIGSPIAWVSNSTHRVKADPSGWAAREAQSPPLRLRPRVAREGAPGEERFHAKQQCPAPHPFTDQREGTRSAGDRGRGVTAQLLRQPSGFEGFLLSGEPLKPHDQSVAKPPQVGLVQLDRDLASAAQRNDCHLYENHITEVAQVPRLPSHLGKQLLRLAPEILCLFRAAIDLRVRQVSAFVQFKVGSEPRPE